MFKKLQRLILKSVPVALLMIALAIGALFGAAMHLPLIPYELPETAATLLGTGLGAIIAIWGSIWVQERAARKDREQLSIAIHSLLHSMQIAVHLAYANPAEDNSPTCKRQAEHIFRAAQDLRKSWGPLIEMLARLDARAGATLYKADAKLQSFLDLGLDAVVDIARRSGDVKFGDSVQWMPLLRDLKDYLDKASRRLKKNVKNPFLILEGLN